MIIPRIILMDDEHRDQETGGWIVCPLFRFNRKIYNNRVQLCTDSHRGKIIVYNATRDNKLSNFYTLFIYLIYLLGRCSLVIYTAKCRYNAIRFSSLYHTWV